MSAAPERSEYAPLSVELGWCDDIAFQTARDQGDTPLRLTLKNPFGSILTLDACPLPDFAVLIGRNGVGKTQLLAGIADGKISGAWREPQQPERYGISSFRTRSSGSAVYSGSVFAEGTAQRFFRGTGGQSPAELAGEIFDRTIEQYGLAPGAHGWQEFEEALRSWIDEPDFRRVGVVRARLAESESDQVGEAIEHYTREIVQRVVGPLAVKNQGGGRAKQPADSYNDDPAILVSMAMKLSRKLAHEIDRDDILRAAHYEGATLANTISQTFTRYKAEQYSWAVTESESGRGDVGSLIDAYRRENTPPWETLREVLASMRQAAGDESIFDFEFSDPEADRLNHANHMQYAFETQMTNRTTGASYKVESLSSGEAILMALCMAWFNQSMGRQRPTLLLLDELDAMLHPSMVGALVSCLKNLFIRHGTKVILATHCPATVAVLEEGEVFRVSRDRGHVRVRPVDRYEAVEELSDGIATLDTGLRIATTDERPVTIVTEGKNSLVLARWAALHFPDDVSVFNRLPHRTGAGDLQSYARILSKMESNSRLLFVWDCDQAKKIGGLEKDIGPTARVALHVLSHRDNTVADGGIENKFEEDLLKPFTEETRAVATGEKLRVVFRKDQKTPFAEHISRHGTEEDFRHFNDLHEIVSRLADEQRRKSSGEAERRASEPRVARIES